MSHLFGVFTSELAASRLSFSANKPLICHRSNGGHKGLHSHRLRSASCATRGSSAPPAPFNSTVRTPLRGRRFTFPQGHTLKQVKHSFPSAEETKAYPPSDIRLLSAHTDSGRRTSLHSLAASLQRAAHLSSDSASGSTSRLRLPPPAKKPHKSTVIMHSWKRHLHHWRS